MYRHTLYVLVAALAANPATADELDYRVADPELKLLRLDSDPTESFLGVRADAAGRLFVGAREALFVHEPDGKGGYLPRKQLVRFPNHTWVYDIEVRGDDLYVITVSALYVIPGGVTKREGLVARRLVWGVPMGHVHQCFHGLAWGPEGDLYFSMGDPLWYYGDFERPDHWGHWTFFHKPDPPSREEWAKTPYTGVGGVFRCRPDGSGFQIVARGLRNSCGLAFDRHWNLFTNDNDHESIPADYVPGRLNHVTPHSYFSWPRGWMPSKTPERADLLETMTTALGRFVPVGQAYHDDVFLPEKYRNNLLVARWCTRAVTRYPLKPRGATFTTEEHSILIGRNHARPVGVCVGRGGRIFATICYMAHNEGSPTYRSDLVMITRADDSPTHPFDAYETTKATAEKLWSELANPSWSRRSTAQMEVLRRGGDLLAEAGRRLVSTQPDKAEFIPLLWLAGASGEKTAGERIRSLLRHADPVVRAQAVRVLTEYPRLGAAADTFTPLLTDADPAVQHAAVLAGFRYRDKLRVEAATAGCGKDTYVRQAAALLFAERATTEYLADLARTDTAAGRLLAVLAIGFRLTLPPATQPIDAALPLEPQRNPDEAYVIPFADARVDLRQHGRLGNFTVAEHWKAGKHTAEQERLFTLLRDRLADSDEQVRLQAAHFLALLNDPRSEPEVAKVRRASDEKRLAVAPLKPVPRLWVTGPFPDGGARFDKVHPPEEGPIDLAAQYDGAGKKLTWQQATPGHRYELAKPFGPCDHSSFYATFRLESISREKVLLLVGSDDGVKVWHNGKLLWTNVVVRSALPFEDAVVLDLQPGSNDILVRVQNETGDCGLYVHYRALGNVVARLPEKLAVASLAERLKTAGSTGVGPEFLKVDWTKEVTRGDATKGRQLFGALSCAKCHAITTDAAVTGGPSLAEARKRFALSDLVESVLLPSKQVSPLFRSTLIETRAGLLVTGLVVSESAEKVEMLLQDATRKTILKKDIAERKQQEQSPMPQGVVKTTDELRDLLAYLLSDNPTPP